MLDQIGDPKNDRAELVETRGFHGPTLRAMLRTAEDEAVASTRGTKTIYHGQIAPAHGESLTREQALEAVEIMERHLGFQGLDRVVVAHTKDGEQHYHVAWNRFDRATGELRAHPHDARRRLEAASEIEERFDLRRLNRDEAKQADARTHAEHQQDDRAAKPKAERVAEITGLWNATDSGKAFKAALEEAGYTVARGARRGFVVVDQAGEIHSLARQIDGAKTADVAARLADIDPASLPEAEAIKAAIKQARKEQRAEQARAAGPLELDSEPDAAPEPQGEAEAPAAQQAEPEKAAIPAILAELTYHHSTFTRAELEQAAAKLHGFKGREAWMEQSGGLDSMSADHRASAERSYEKWAAGHEQSASRFDLAHYVAFTQGKRAEERQAADPVAEADRQTRKAAARSLAAEIEASPELVTLGPDRTGRDRFTSRAMLETEMKMEAAAADLAGREGHAVAPKKQAVALKSAEKLAGYALGSDQREAFGRFTDKGDLALMMGAAGTGKSSVFQAARMAWEAEGFRVLGMAPSGIAAEGLENGSGIKSRTVHAFIAGLDNQEGMAAGIKALDQKIAGIKGGRSQKAARFKAGLQQQRAELAHTMKESQLTDRDVIVIDEIGMVGSRQLERILTAAKEAGAAVRGAGDYEQIQAVEAGAAARSLVERHAGQTVRLSEVHRQADAWQKAATTAFHQARPAEALAAYRDHGMIHQAATHQAAAAELVGDWTAHRAAKPEARQIMLAYTNADVGDLNRAGRAAYRAEGRLGQDHDLALKDGGAITLAEGDRVYFLQNRHLKGPDHARVAVKNGSLATVEKIEGTTITARLDNGKTAIFDTREYGAIAHGYAATIHKTQGVTADRAFVLASEYMRRQEVHVGMTRHRERADIYSGADKFKTVDDLIKHVSRDGAKDTTLDYTGRAERAEQAPTHSLRSAVRDIWTRIKDAFGWQRPDMPEARQEAPEAAKRDELSELMAKRTNKGGGRRDNDADALSALLAKAKAEREAAKTPEQRAADARQDLAEALRRSREKGPGGYEPG
jgi:ATP-dependent exoDNAse (exonuclease V) alpha subunit